MSLRWLLIILGILITIVVGLVIVILAQKNVLELGVSIPLGVIAMSAVIKYLHGKIKAIGKKRDKIEGWIHEHNEKDLIIGFNELFRDGFDYPKRKYAVEHLKGYNLDRLWSEYEYLGQSRCYLNIQDFIEKVIERKTPSEIIKIVVRSDSPPDRYDSYQTALYIYVVIRNKRCGMHLDFFRKTFNESWGYFEIINPVTNVVYAKIVQEKLADEFLEIIMECINSEEIDARFKLCEEEEQKRKEIRKKLERELNKITEDFAKHDKIKGSCERCEDWLKDLVYL